MATALVGIPVVKRPIARSPKHGIVLFDKTAHFRVAFYCPQQKVIMLFNQLLDMPQQVDGLSWQRRNAH
jgi:hypothetical protein